MKMKKCLSVLLCVIVLCGALSGCGKALASEPVSSGGLRIVTTIFPEYDWVMRILGENPGHAEVTMLLDNGVDLHSYQPTAADILRVATCDLFIYVGGESDEWVEDALREATNREMVVINLLEVLGDAVKEEELVEGMQGEEEEEEEGEEEEPEYDEHVWLSLKNASVLTSRISGELQRLDPEHAAVYAANTASYLAQLEALDKEYRETVAGAGCRTLLFGDRFPFRYLTDDYGLTYYAAFVGCSAETEASFETITFLAAKEDELALPAILTIEGPDHRIAETIAANTASGERKILTMDSMQSTTSKDAEAGVTYLSVLEKNLDVLREALQ